MPLRDKSSAGELHSATWVFSQIFCCAKRCRSTFQLYFSQLIAATGKTIAQCITPSSNETQIKSTDLLTYLLTCLLTFLFTYLLTYLPTYLLRLSYLPTYLLTYLSTYLHIHWVSLLLLLLLLLLTYLLTYLLSFLPTYLRFSQFYGSFDKGACAYFSFFVPRSIARQVASNWLRSVTGP